MKRTSSVVRPVQGLAWRWADRRRRGGWAASFRWSWGCRSWDRWPCARRRSACRAGRPMAATPSWHPTSVSTPAKPVQFEPIRFGSNRSRFFDRSRVRLSWTMPRLWRLVNWMRRQCGRRINSGNRFWSPYSLGSVIHRGLNSSHWLASQWIAINSEVQSSLVNISMERNSFQLHCNKN